MSKTQKPIYDESKIKTLSSLEHIRLRPGMYIGRMGDGSHPDDGIYILLKEIIDNSIDEFIMGAGKKIDVNIDGDGVQIRDFGRGIPLGKLIECVSVINTGGKFNTDAFQFSVGLNGVGTKATNALAEKFIVTSIRDGNYRRATFSDGELLNDEKGKTDDKNGTEVFFVPSHEFFPKYDFDPKIIRRRLWNYAYLNTGLSLYYNEEIIYSKSGLLDMLNKKIDDDAIYEIMHFKDDTIEFALTHTDNFGETYYSFVNGQFTNDGGTHQSAFREGILKAINEYASKNFNSRDVRNGVVGVIAIKLKEPLFESQTKNKLGNNEVRSEIVSKVKDVIHKYLHKNKETAEILLKKISLNEQVRKEIQAVKTKSKEKAKKASIKIPKLKDCKFHLNDGSEKGMESVIFLTEGQSASGSMVSSRDPETQAIFSLKGKPQNCFGRKRKLVYKNEELYFIMRALNVEDDFEELRYEKIIIATDADVDGLHIRNLLLTYFLQFFEQLVLSEHIYVLETPLFRVRNKKETIYCYDIAERDRAINKLGKTHEVTRFKGLGEISPNEFGQFIGPDIRLRTINVDNIRKVQKPLEFFMGNNTPERKDYIIKNLI
ncbi:MAG: toprim domain-containing protein [Verrucomicrobiota bacterium]|nr:toprim domain-containing protein [Verrucomicrobiota bacterium]